MQDNKSPNIIYLGFTDNKIPTFREVKSKDWILFGEDNLFPEHLLYLYNKSSNHGAIVNGKVKYIFGKGFPIENTELMVVNRNNESLNKITKKVITDIELFGGFHLEIIWKMGGKMEVLHMPFECLRRCKENTGWWYKEDWKCLSEKARFIPNYNPENKQGAAIFSYREYRAGRRNTRCLATWEH